MVSYLSNQYSVPPGYIGKAVGLQVYDKTLYIYHNMILIAQHHYASVIKIVGDSYRSRKIKSGHA